MNKLDVVKNNIDLKFNKLEEIYIDNNTIVMYEPDYGYIALYYKDSGGKVLLYSDYFMLNYFGLVSTEKKIIEKYIMDKVSIITDGLFNPEKSFKIASETARNLYDSYVLNIIDNPDDEEDNDYDEYNWL